MASEIMQIRQHVAEEHPQLSQVIGKEGLSELVNLIDQVIDAKLDQLNRNKERDPDHEQRRSDADQGLSNADQTASGSDQAAANMDHGAANRSLGGRLTLEAIAASPTATLSLDQSVGSPVRVVAVDNEDRPDRSHRPANDRHHQE